jgi:hypothetical protein
MFLNQDARKEIIIITQIHIIRNVITPCTETDKVSVHMMFISVNFKEGRGVLLATNEFTLIDLVVHRLVNEWGRSIVMGVDEVRNLSTVCTRRLFG